MSAPLLPSGNVFRQACDAIPVIIWMADEHASVTFCNRFFCEFTGRPLENALGYGWLEVVHPDDRARCLEMADTHRENHTAYAFECRVLCADGTYHWTLVQVRVSLGPDGSFAAYVGSCVDISDRKRAEEALSRLAAIVQASDDAITSGTPDGTLVTWNSGAERLYGYSAEETRGRPASMLIPADRQHEMEEIHTRLAAGEPVPPYETVRLRKDGTPVPVSLRACPIRDAAGQLLGISVIARDVTRRRQAETALRESEERFRLLIEHGSEIISILDVEGRFRYVSPSVKTTLGYEPEGLTGADAFSYVHPEDVAAAHQALERIMAQPGATLSAEFRLRHRDGSWRFLESVGTNLLHVRGLEGIVFNSRDTTERKKIEQQLIASHDQLRQLGAHMESIRERERICMAREIHDELGQMLSMLKLDLEGLGARFHPAARLRQEYDDRISRMVNNVELTIKTVRRISAELRPGILDHLGLASAMDWQIQEFRARTGIHCSAKGLEEKIPLNAEQSTAVFRIFQEILTNVVRHADASAVSVDIRIKAGRLVLKVNDNGKGMEEHHLSDPASLGLLGMRERATLLGGTLEFASQPGRGTLVTLRVPLSAPAARG